MKKNRWWLAIPVAFGVMISNVLIGFLYIVVYSHVIDPGHDEAYYQAYADVSMPYSSVIAGLPLMFMAGRWIGGKFPVGNRVKAALLVWLVYALIDFSIVAAIGALAQIALIFAISFMTKFLAAYLGGRWAENAK